MKKRIFLVMIVGFVVSIAGCEWSSVTDGVGGDDSADSRSMTWKIARPKLANMEHYTLPMTCVTTYKTFDTKSEFLHTGNPAGNTDDPDFDKDDWKIFVGYKPYGTVSVRGEDGEILIYPDSTTGRKVEMLRWKFWKCHLEGSAWIWNPDTGKQFVLNLAKPSQNAVEHPTDPTSALTADAQFRIFSDVFYGKDAYPANSNGLVPWRTAAVNLSKYKIPMGSWIYIKTLDGIPVPLPLPNDMRDPVTGQLWDPTNLDQQVHFKWVTHDGWVKATDISWSLPDWITLSDDNWFDLCVGTDKIMRWCWDQSFLNKSLQQRDKDGNLLFDDDGKPVMETEYTDVEVYPYAEVPVFGRKGVADSKFYFYLKRGNEDSPLSAKRYLLQNQFQSADISDFVFGSKFNDSDSVNPLTVVLFDDTDTVRWDPYSDTSGFVSWAFDSGVVGVGYSHSPTAGYDGRPVWISQYATEYRLEYRSNPVGQPTSQRLEYLTSEYTPYNMISGDFDYDLENEILIQYSKTGTRAKYYSIFEYRDQAGSSPFGYYYDSAISRVYAAHGAYTCNFQTATADYDGDGKDDVVSISKAISATYRVSVCDIFNQNTIEEVYNSDTGGLGVPYSAGLMYLDSDLNADIVMSTDTGMYRMMSTHLSPRKWVKMSTADQYKNAYVSSMIRKVPKGEDAID